MAYMSQERKAQLAPAIRAVLKKYRLKGSISVDHSSTLVVTIRAGAIDFVSNSNQVAEAKGHHLRPNYRPAKDSLDVNPYWYQEHFDGTALACLQELLPAMNAGNHDRSDAMTDYFDVGWYVTVRIGSWNRPYEVTA
jgi:hypothetical protein